MIEIKMPRHAFRALAIGDRRVPLSKVHRRGPIFRGRYNQLMDSRRAPVHGELVCYSGDRRDIGVFDDAVLWCDAECNVDDWNPYQHRVTGIVSERILRKARHNLEVYLRVDRRRYSPDQRLRRWALRGPR